MRLNYSLVEILNDKLFVSEALTVVYSFVGVLLTVPLTTIFLVKGLKSKLLVKNKAPICNLCYMYPESWTHSLAN